MSSTTTVDANNIGNRQKFCRRQNRTVWTALYALASAYCVQVLKCPAGQICRITSDDCTPGEQCRDAPMPYCTGKSRDIESLVHRKCIKVIASASYRHRRLHVYETMRGTILIWRYRTICVWIHKQEAQLMLTTGSTRLAVSRGQQTWYHSTCYI